MRCVGYVKMVCVCLGLSLVGWGCLGDQNDGSESNSGGPDTTVSDVEGDAPAVEDDGGIDAQQDGGGDADGGLAKPNQCGDSSLAVDYLRRAGTREATWVDWKEEVPSVFEATIPPDWTLVSGPPPESTTFDATWEGVVGLEQSVELLCPPFAEQAGLTCATDQAFEVTRSTGAGDVTNRFATSVPLSELNLPSQGTAVEVTYASEPGSDAYDTSWSDDPSGELQFRVDIASSGETVLAMGETFGEKNSQSYSHSYGDLTIGMPGGYDDAASAHCVALGACPRVYRFEDLTVSDGQDSQSVSPGSTATVSMNQTQYTFWHVVSLRRNAEMSGWETGTCADAWRPKASFAYGRK